MPLPLEGCIAGKGGECQHVGDTEWRLLFAGHLEVRFVVCGVWCVVCGVVLCTCGVVLGTWSVMCDMRRVACGMWDGRRPEARSRRQLIRISPLSLSNYR